jgi:serine protease Do
LNTAIFTSGGGSEGIGFARPINDVKKFIDETRRHGRVRVPWVGLWVAEVAQDSATAVRSGGVAVSVSAVDSESAAGRAGIKEGDQILSINGKQISGISDWNRMIANIYVGDRLELALKRRTETIDVGFAVEEFKESDLLKTRVVVHGMHVQDINRDLIRKYGLAYNEGVVVTKVDPNSLGQRLGIEPGDVILRVGNARIRNKEDFQRASMSQRDMSIIIDRNGRIVQLYLGL